MDKHAKYYNGAITYTGHGPITHAPLVSRSNGCISATLYIVLCAVPVVAVLVTILSYAK